MSTIGNKINKRNLPYIFSWVLLASVFLFVCVFLERKITGQLNADASSEMVLSKLLADSGKLVLTSDWGYSTELRVLNIQIIWGLLFRFISDWHIVRVVGTIIYYLLLLVSVRGLCKEIGINRYFPLIGSCFLLPLCLDSYQFYLTQVGYMTHVIISINLLTLSLKYLNANKKTIRTLILIIGFVFSCVVGLAGIRHLSVFMAPLLLTMFLYFLIELKRHNKIKLSDYYYVLVSSIGILLGYIINNKILSKYIFFGNYNNTQLTALNTEKLKAFIDTVLNQSGYLYMDSVSFLTLFKNICALVLLALIIYSVFYTIIKINVLNKSALINNLFFISGMVVYLGIQIFTNAPSEGRYIIPIFVFSFIMVFTIFDLKETKLKRILITIFISCFVVNGLITFNSNRNNQLNKNEQEVADFLSKNDYKNGYSFFWQANLIQELSNGEVDVWSWGFIYDRPEDFKDLNYANIWLQNRNHSKYTPTGKTFIVLDEEQLNKYKTLVNLLKEKVIFKNEEYTVFGTDTFEELQSILE